MALALPTQIVCREDCLGLCGICGENLNEAGPEHVHEREPDPRWAALRELKLDRLPEARARPAHPDRLRARTAAASARFAARTSTRPIPSHEHESAPDERWAALRELQLD